MFSGSGGNQMRTGSEYHTTVVDLLEVLGEDGTGQGPLNRIRCSEHCEPGTDGVLLESLNEVPGSSADAVGCHHDVCCELLAILEYDAGVVVVLEVISRPSRVLDGDA